jgi:hypothetical protein
MGGVTEDNNSCAGGIRERAGKGRKGEREKERDRETFATRQSQLLGLSRV